MAFARSILRGILYALSFVYDRLVQLRLYFYRKRIFRERALGVLVISVGNLTVGGTGKTPIVEKLLAALQTGGRRVAILSRGYKSVPRKRSLLSRLYKEDADPPRIVSDGASLLLDSLTAGDEPYMLAHNLKNVIVLVDKDRVKSGLLAIDKWKVDTLLARRRFAVSPSQTSPGHRRLWIGKPRLAMNSFFLAARCARRREICAAPATSSSPKTPANRMMP